MRGFVYVACLVTIAVWTVASIVSVVWGFTSALPLLAAAEAEPEFLGTGTYTVFAIGMTLALSQWGLVVIPLALIAILARPSWPVTEVRRAPGTARPRRGAEPSIAAPSRVSSLPA